MYRATDVCGFCRVRDPYGLFQNFARLSKPIEVNGLAFRTSEALYQTLKTVDGQAQQWIAGGPDPKSVKRRGRAAPQRADWPELKVAAMRLTLHAKHLVIPGAVEAELRHTGTRPIVEISRHDAFWGAQPKAGGTLVGVNMLGRLWMELREEVRTGQVLSIQTLGEGFVVNGDPVKKLGRDIQVPVRRAGWKR